MPKTKNIPRAQQDHATQSNLATTSNSNNLNHNTTAATTLTSPPTRPRLHASRTTNTNSAMATRHRRSKENSENPGAEKENTGRAGRSTRTHVTPGVLSTAFVSSNLATSAFTSNFNPATNSNSTSILGTKSKKLLAAPQPPPPTDDKPKPKKPTLVKRRAQKVPLQDVTAQFVASGTGEGANRAGTAYAHLGEEEILALREEAVRAGGGEGGGGGGVQLEALAAESEMGVQVATPSRSRGHRNQGGQTTSPLPPSSPPSDYRLPSSALNFNSNLAPSVLPRPVEPVSASPAQSIPVPEYDPWGSFDSAPPVGSPSRPVSVRVGKDLDHDEDEGSVDREDPFGFAALERKLKADRAGHEAHEARGDAHRQHPEEYVQEEVHEDGETQHEEAQHEEEEDEDIDAIPVADTSSPRPEGLRLVHRARGNRNLKRTRERALEEEGEADDDDDEMAEKHDEEDPTAAHRYGSSSPGPIIPRLRGIAATRSAILSSPVRAALASTPVAASATGTSPVHAHAHVATPPTPHKDRAKDKDARKRRRISSVLDAVADITHDVFGPCLLPTSSSASSPGQVHAESPSPTKGSVKRPAAARDRVSVRVPAVQTVRVPAGPTAAGGAGAVVATAVATPEGAGTVSGDALDAFNAVLDAQDAREVAPEPAEEPIGRSLRPRPSRVVLDDDKENEKKKPRSASRGRGRGLGRGATRGRGSKSRGRGASRSQAEKEGGDGDVDEEEMDSDEKFEQARQARIAYFRGLDAYEVETEDVYLV